MGTIPASENVFPLVRLGEVAAPATPPAGEVHLYAKADGLLYWKDDAGTEYPIDVGAHLADTADAHDASAISVLDTAAHFTGTDVEAVLAELATAGGGGDLDDLGDVNAPTPSDGDVLTWDSTPGEWIAAAPGAGGGAADDPIADNFGAADTAFEFDTSSLTGLTATSTTADVEDADTSVAGNLYLSDNDSQLVGRYAAVSAPFTAICKISDANIRENYSHVGLFCGIGTPGKLVFIGVRVGDGQKAWVGALTGPTDTGPGTPSTSQLPVNAVQFPCYLGIRAASDTDISYLFSYNGRIWHRVVASHDNSMTVGSVGVGIYMLTGNTASGAFDFLRIWNSAKTFVL